MVMHAFKAHKAHLIPALYKCALQASKSGPACRITSTNCFFFGVANLCLAQPGACLTARALPTPACGFLPLVLQATLRGAQSIAAPSLCMRNVASQYADCKRHASTGCRQVRCSFCLLVAAFDKPLRCLLQDWCCRTEVHVRGLTSAMKPSRL